MRVVLAIALASSLVLSIAPEALAETLAAPIGGRPIALGAERVACKESLANTGWIAESEGHALRPPTSEEALGAVVTLRVAPNEAGCAASSTTVALVAVGAKPSADPASIVVDVDAGRAVVRGKRLKGAVLGWSASGHRGDDVCTTPDVVQGAESCSFALPRDLPADPTAIDLFLLPPGARVISDGTLFDAAGRRTPIEEYAVRIAQVVLARLVAPDVSIDVSTGTGRIAVLHPEAVGAIDCADATCVMDGRDLVVRGEHGGDDKVDAHVQLRPRVVLKNGTTSETLPLLSLPLQRCPVSIASGTPIANLPDQRVVVRVGGSCASSDAELAFVTPFGGATVERTELIAGDRYVVVHVGRVDTDVVPLSVRRRGTVVGIAPIAPRRLPPLRARLEIPAHGAIDFVPTNRWARVFEPAAASGGALETIAVDGAYDVKHDAEGTWIRGAEGASGAAFIRFAYADRKLPDALRGTHLAEVSEPVDRALHVANVPVPLGALARAPQPLVEMLCGTGEGGTKPVLSEVTASIPYRARDTCQIVIHRERLRDEDGAQAFQVSIQVSSSDGAPRSEARIDRRLVLKHADVPTFIAIAGASAPFDRILVRVGIADDETHYVERSPEQGGSSVQWSVVTGTELVRLYGTAAIPTGLFRVADQGHSGILTLSVGALIRAVLLSKEGTEFPLGLEAGAMWLGIAGDTDPAASSRGAVALVVGPGISVPIANTSRSTQTSIALHAWFEYEVSRVVLSQGGQPFGFVFGPSISIGDVGANF